MVHLAARVLPVFTNPANTRWGAADVFGSDLYRALEVLKQKPRPVIPSRRTRSPSML